MGPIFQASARQQVLNAGATLSNEKVTEVVVTGDQIEVTTEAGTNSADFVVLGEEADALSRRIRNSNKRWRRRNCLRRQKWENRVDAVCVLVAAPGQTRARQLSQLAMAQLPPWTSCPRSRAKTCRTGTHPLRIDGLPLASSVPK